MLTDQQVIQLKLAHKQTREKRLADRIKAVLYVHFGLSYAEIAKLLLFDEITIRRYVKLFMQKGIAGLLEYRYRGGRSHLTPPQEIELKIFLKAHTKRTAKEVADYVAKTYSIKFTVIGVTKLLHRLGFVYKKPKLMPPKVNPDKQAEFLKTYTNTKASLSPKDGLYFIDSTHPQHNVQPDYGWILKGKKNDKFIKSNSGRARLNLNGVLNFHDKTALVLEEKRINKEATIRLFNAIRKKQPHGKVYLVLDNASYHHSHLVKNWILRHPRFKLLFIPAYSPNLNLIERLWRFFHQKVTWNHYFETFEEFKTTTLDFFKNLKLYEKELSTLLTDNFQLYPAKVANLS